VERAVHGLHAIIRIVQFHWGVHVLRVEAFMAADLPQVHTRYMRGVDQGIATFDALIAHPLFHDLADHGALGMPEDQTGARYFLDGKQIELLAQQAVVAPLRLFQAGKVLLQLFGGEECCSIDPLQLRILFVAQPIGAGKAYHLEGLYTASGGHMGAAAKVFELAVAIERYLFARFGEALDEVRLHEVIRLLKALQAFIA
jgi:hypothetical protein